jgi:hypothetical protein
MSPYADYTFYTDSWHGTKISSTEFDQLSLIASQHIDTITYGRIGDNVTTSVKYAMCSIADALYDYNDSGNKVSVSVGKVSESYQVSGKSKDEIIYEAAYQWLINTGLLYKGAYAYAYE